MNKNQFCEAEQSRLDKLSAFKLPNYFKQIGIVLFGLGFLALIFTSKMEPEQEIIRTAFRKLLLIGLILVSLSRDKTEDELTLKLRSQSYSMAFICGVIYAVIQPYVNYLVRVYLKGQEIGFEELGGFQVLIFMLLIQIGFFELLKRMR
ncbi:MAG: hypothetical protein KDC85_15970 [Saprospiraceae bacterium]|nr:hypothetical protein [Saprospiraceae bacterium]MCB9325917.1 hypothetical protein [Lewinellaceae bacterium]